MEYFGLKFWGIFLELGHDDCISIGTNWALEVSDTKVSDYYLFLRYLQIKKRKPDSSLGHYLINLDTIPSQNSLTILNSNTPNHSKKQLCPCFFISQLSEKWTTYFGQNYPNFHFRHFSNVFKGEWEYDIWSLSILSNDVSKRDLILNHKKAKRLYKILTPLSKHH